MARAVRASTGPDFAPRESGMDTSLCPSASRIFLRSYRAAQQAGNKKTPPADCLAGFFRSEGSVTYLRNRKVVLTTKKVIGNRPGGFEFALILNIRHFEYRLHAITLFAFRINGSPILTI